MASSFHRCHHCGYETDFSNTLAAFEDNPHCRQCGLSIGESDTKMQDDLINLMTRNLQLNPIQQQRQDISMPSTPQVVPQSSSITYITQHYHHSSHQASLPDTAVSTHLENVGVNVSLLSPSQLQLFRNAEAEQQKRLIELWTIAPLTPEHQMIAKNLGTWTQATMEQEEDAARHRWESSTTEDVPKSASNLIDQETSTCVEPYLVRGYENLPVIGTSDVLERQAVSLKPNDDKSVNDPLYTSREWWHMTEDEPMEHQYGMLQQMMFTYPMSYTNRVEDDDDEMS